MNDDDFNDFLSWMIPIGVMTALVIALLIYFDPTGAAYVSTCAH